MKHESRDMIPLISDQTGNAKRPIRTLSLSSQLFNDDSKPNIQEKNVIGMHIRFNSNKRYKIKLLLKRKKKNILLHVIYLIRTSASLT